MIENKKLVVVMFLNISARPSDSISYSLFSMIILDSNWNDPLLECTVRSSRPEVFCKKGVLRNFTKFIGKHLCQSLFFY